MKKLKKDMVNSFTINSDFSKYKDVFLKENSKLNLISKNDEKFLYEKHIYDSLAIKLFEKKYGIKKGSKLLDVGCGGGFPCVPIAIEYNEIQIFGIDSIRKKINAINNIKEELQLKNLTTICDRAENLRDRKFDIITSRAVASLAKISEYALPLLNINGYFIAYKSKKIADELQESKTVFNKYNAKAIDIIEYTLPTDEIFERNLVIIQINAI